MSELRLRLKKLRRLDLVALLELDGISYVCGWHLGRALT